MGLGPFLDTEVSVGSFAEMPTVRRRQASSQRSRTSPKLLLKEIRAQTRSAGFKRFVQNLLLDLCRIDTTPRPEVALMQEAEAQCFSRLERELQSLGTEVQIRRIPVNPQIQEHPFFSLLHFTKTPDRPEGLSPEQAYSGRSNLVCVAPGTGSRPGRSVALNAHLDVVAPYISPRARSGVIHGRGACDDKGPVVAIVAALKVLSEFMKGTGLKWNRNVVCMFVVEEETGGNGSLSLAIDRELKRLYDMAMVCECTGLKIYPANRGAVWYRAEVRAPEGLSALELAAFIIEELEKEGAAIRAESNHPLFPQRPVQTCHGMLGSFGEHPSRICGEVSFFLRTPGRPHREFAALVRDCLQSGLDQYIGLYGDKSKVKDPATGQPMVSRHYELRKRAEGYRVTVWGAPGHMGSVRERDGAITKMAHLVRSLTCSKRRLERTAGGSVSIELEEQSKGALVLEGGQGFVPTHSMDEIMQRLRQAAENGARQYLGRADHPATASDCVKVTYEKLHNAAFDGDPESPSMVNATAAARLSGLGSNEPVRGWTVSCDARIFALEYPGMPVLTFGPGQLAFAHSDHEQIKLEEIRAAAEFLALFLLKETGTASW